MKLIIIRHGEPNYAIDGLTEKGQREAELLKKRLLKENITKVYCSTLGRARLTIKPTLEALGIEAEYCPWLREFDYSAVIRPGDSESDCCWDILPEEINKLENIYSPTKWIEEDFIKNSNIPMDYKTVCEELDAVLKRHGYKREGYNYKAVSPNHDTIIFVCHFGLTSVLLSHLLNCSPYSLWQHTCTPPTAMSIIYTEERVKGKALFRASTIADTSHLYADDEEVSFSARFCECFTDNTRHN